MMRPTRSDLPKNVRQKAIHALEPLLIDAVDLQTQLKQAHWTVRGPTFLQLHELFDSIAKAAGDWADLLAERIAQLGGVPLATARMVARGSSLKEYNFKASTGPDHCEAVADALAAFAASARAAIDAADKLGDKATADLFTEVCRDADKQLWFVEAHLDREARTPDERKPVPPSPKRSQ
jgi:starvation-inducible DNA-binding protein